MNPWERRTPFSALVGRETRAEQGMSFEERAERYRSYAERVIHAEKLATLARGFVTGCGGAEQVNPEDCERFVRDHPDVLKKALDTVPEEDLPLAVHMLVKALDDR